MQNWKKLGLLFNESNYAAVPIFHRVNDDKAHVYFSARDSFNRSKPCFADLNLRTMEISQWANLEVPLGALGSFDEHGIMPCSILQKDNSIWMYYIGWNLGVTVPFRNALGLLISRDQGQHFEKFSDGPILDRSVYDKCFVASNFVHPEQDFYRMYYLSCNSWDIVNGEPRHSYNIKYATSQDAINWERQGQVAIDFKSSKEYALSTPRVLLEQDTYRMWYSYRGSIEAPHYRIGYAESKNARDWVRKDNLVRLTTSKEGWDSEMICYPYVFQHRGRYYMLYNGNDYGRTGFGLAVLEDSP